MLQTIPAELGTLIPDPIVLCSECGESRTQASRFDREPLCFGCRLRDDTVARDLAGRADGYAERRESVVPVEVLLASGRRVLPFGSGSGEIASADIVEALRYERAVEEDARLCRRLTFAFLTFEGLILLAVAALR